MTKKYIVYRSRFQPRFQSYNEKAISWLHEHVEKKELLLALVSDDLFDDRDEKIKGLYNNVFKDADYRGRFHKDLQPESSIGRIQSSIYDSDPNRQIRIFLSPNTILLSCVIYHSMPTDYHSIYRHFMHEKPENIRWYFPIFDKDDLNDLGFVGLIFDQKYSHDIQENAFFFSRFNYHNMSNHQFIHCVNSTYYGAYAKSIADNKEAQTRLKNSIGSLEGMTIPDVDNIPYIYVFSDLKKMTTKVYQMLNCYIRNIDSRDDRLIESFTTQRERLLRFSKNLEHVDVKYTNKLVEFYRLILNLIIKIEDIATHSSLYKLNDFIAILKDISKKKCEYNSIDCFVRQDCFSCDDYNKKNISEKCCWEMDWLEDSETANKRCSHFVSAIDTILSELRCEND
jgi:hypothetical protein